MAENPQGWPGRLSDEIEAAGSGDAEVGRELIGLAALQLRECGQLEPDLVKYLGSVLESVYRGSPARAAHALNIAPPPTPSNRPADEERNARIMSCYNLVLERLHLAPGDAESLRLDWEDTECADDAASREAELRALHQNRGDLLQESKPTQDRTYQLTAQLFNELLQGASYFKPKPEWKPITKGVVRGVTQRARAKRGSTRKSV